MYNKLDEFVGKSLKGTYIEYNTEFLPSRNEILANKIYFLFTNGYILLSPENNLDELIIEMFFGEYSLDVEMNQENCLSENLGKKLSEIWNSKNSRDYEDLIIFSFEQ